MIRLTAVIELEGQAPRALTYESNATSIILGRDESADFRIPLSTVSRQHIRITETDGVHFIEDLGSTHGTMLNGIKLRAHDKAILNDAAIIEVTRAKITCSIARTRVAVADGAEGTQVIAARAVEGILGRLGEAHGEGPFLRVVAGPDEGRRLVLSGTGSEWSIGRSRDCEFMFDDQNISRKHAIIRKDWHGFLIEDAGSRNGVLIAGRRITQPRRMRDRDEITVGPLRLLFIDPDAELLEALKEVPGFEVNDPPSELEPDLSVMGSPGSDQVSSSALNPVSSAQSPVPLAEEASKSDSANVSSTSMAKRFNIPVEWIIAGVVGIVTIVLAMFILAVVV